MELDAGSYTSLSFRDVFGTIVAAYSCGLRRSFMLPGMHIENVNSRVHRLGAVYLLVSVFDVLV